MVNTSFLVKRDDIHQHTVITSETAHELENGDVLLAIDHFAFTANNITYAAFGDAMKYWDFFPAENGWGCVPVWGFADVVDSKNNGIKVGERFYGYYPMATHLHVTPDKISPNGFIDAATHRSHLSPIYNFYTNTATDAGYAPEQESLQMVFRPLFMTSYLIDDLLDDNSFFGAQQVVLSSASSKTAYGLAFLLAQRSNIDIIGLTSPSNIPFVESLGSYSNVVSYDDITSLDPNVPTVFVDMAGSGPVRSALHHHFTDKLVYSCSVGASHWDKMGSNEGLPGAKPTLFFAPARAQKRTEDWGRDGLQERSSKAWLSFVEKASDWVTIVEKTGTENIATVYNDTLEGKANPQNGYILKF